ncbi:MAG TPA: thermonuclease family protein [Bryobacteraceae bacterium]|nr:thermonuclease family protein [Bryobacteraceae bacterium]
MQTHTFIAAVLVVAQLVAFSSAGCAAESPRLVGEVIKVVDGDTLDVRLDSGPIRVRLHAADTPERAQPYGKDASAALAQLVLHKIVEIEPFEQDRYERLVGIVYLQNKNINAELIRAGHAWAFRRYMRKADAELCALEAAARQAHRGLWKLKTAERIAPWEYRSRKSRHSFTDYANETASQCIAAIGKRY